MPDSISFQRPEIIAKAWGSETVIINLWSYCGKILSFEAGKCFSLHYHMAKTETWYVLEGELAIDYFDLQGAKLHQRRLSVGDVIHVPPGNPHRLTAITPARVIEVSTHHEDSDSYRIAPGASQQ